MGGQWVVLDPGLWVGQGKYYMCLLNPWPMGAMGEMEKFLSMSRDIWKSYLSVCEGALEPVAPIIHAMKAFNEIRKQKELTHFSSLLDYTAFNKKLQQFV